MLLFVFLTITISCVHSEGRDNLTDINSLIDENPDSAIVRLNEINVDDFSKDELMYYSLLSIKSKDKAYIHHDSDSLISIVVDYYSHRYNKDLYTEALYYGGRVANDLGDYPKALRFYQDALDLTGNDPSLKELKGNILSQTGRLLNTLRLYSQAIPYLKEVIKMEREEKDTINLAYDLQLIGAVYLHLDSLDKAAEFFKEVEALQSSLTESINAVTQMYKASIKLKQGNKEDALIIIRGVPERIKGNGRFTAIGYASEIYLENNILDTAYLYAKQLIEQGTGKNEKFGYRILLSPNLKDLIPQDSLIYYVQRFSDYSYDFIEKNGKEEALIQNSMYNYSLHDKARLKSESKLLRLSFILIFALILIFILFYRMLYIKYKSKKHILHLKNMLDNLTRFEQRMTENNKDNVLPLQFEIENQDYINLVTEDTLRKKLQEKYLTLYARSKGKITIHDLLLQSEIYTVISDKINNNGIISDWNPLWKEIEKLILKVSPSFKHHLLILTGGKIKEPTYKMCMLMKFGIRAGQIANLMGRSKNAVSNRQKLLGIAIFDEKIDNKMLHYIISLM